MKKKELVFMILSESITFSETIYSAYTKVLTRNPAGHFRFQRICGETK